MKYKDYKISEIKENRDWIIARVKFYEGDFKDVEIEGKIFSQYQREKLLKTKQFKFPLGSDIRKELNKEIHNDVKARKYKCLNVQKYEISI